MPVTEQTPYNSHAANGVTTVFAYSFKAIQSADILVTVDGVTKTLTTDYTLSGIGNDGGGNVTFLVAPANGTTVLIQRDMAYDRATDYQENGDFLAATVDNDIDRIVLMLQQLATRAFQATTSLVWDAASRLISNVSDPVSAQDAATKNYVDQVATGTLGSPLSIVNGGTGSSTAATARTALGLAIGADVQAFDANIVKKNAAQTFTAAQKTTPATDNDLSFDLSAANDFYCTPTAGGTLTFTNITAGCKGEILLVNASNYTIAKAATVKCPSTMLTTISATGRYRLAYSSIDGTNVDITSSAALS